MVSDFTFLKVVRESTRIIKGNANEMEVYKGFQQGFTGIKGKHRLNNWI